MLSLILRFYDPQAGVIELDGRDLRTITQRRFASILAS